MSIYSPFFARQKKRIFLFFLWGNPVQNRPQNAFSLQERVDLRSHSFFLGTILPGEGWGGQGKKKEKGCTKKVGLFYYEARNDCTNNSETVLLCNRCVCNWKINSKRILLRNWRLQKVPHGGAQITQKNSCQKTLCNRCPVQLGN